jgi:hypothetical protein
MGIDGRPNMSEENRPVSLRGWQWSLVIVVALVAGIVGGMVGGFIGGGVKVLISDDSPRFYGTLDRANEEVPTTE